MGEQQVKTIKPFLSVLLMMCFLFAVAFIKMENRRMGYSFVKLARGEKEMRDRQRQRAVHLARVLSPERIQILVTKKLPMKKATRGQIIHMTNKDVAIIQQVEDKFSQ